MLHVCFLCFYTKWWGFLNSHKIMKVNTFQIQYKIKMKEPRWLSELGNWITYQLVQAYHQYGVGSCPAL